MPDYEVLPSVIEASLAELAKYIAGSMTGKARRIL